MRYQILWIIAGRSVTLFLHGEGEDTRVHAFFQASGKDYENRYFWQRDRIHISILL